MITTVENSVCIFYFILFFSTYLYENGWDKFVEYDGISWEIKSTAFSHMCGRQINIYMKKNMRKKLRIQESMCKHIDEWSMFGNGWFLYYFNNIYNNVFVVGYDDGLIGLHISNII